jgi:Tfp pilus assembly protein PilZ
LAAVTARCTLRSVRTKVTLPLRFVSLEESLHSTSRDLGVEGIFVQCVEGPELGTRVILEVQFKQGTASCFAEVDEVALDAHDPGFFARFVAPSAHFLDLVRETIVRVRAGEEAARSVSPPSTASGTSRRSSARFPGALVVKLGGRGQLPGVFATSVSATGLFVLMPNPPEVGSILNLELELPDKRPPVQVTARVVRVIDAAEAAAQRTAPGAGLAFIGGDDEFRRRFTAYLSVLGFASS